MMKRITLLMFAFLGAIAVNAQTIYFEDNFDDEDISDWTIVDADGDGNVWGNMFVVTDDTGTPMTPVSLISRSWLGDPLTPDNWVISPAIDLTGATNVVLNWKVLAAAASWDNEHYSVYIATSDQIADLEASSVTFSETYDDPNDAGTQYDRSLDLSSFAGQTVYVAFRHHNVTNMDYLSIDDVAVEEGTLNIDQHTIAGFQYYYQASTQDLVLSADQAFSQINLHNILGQQVVSKELSSTNETINLSSLETGVYLVNVDVNGKRATFKIVKR